LTIVGGFFLALLSISIPIYAETINDTFVEIFPQTITSNEKTNIRISLILEPGIEKTFEIIVLTPNGKSYKSEIVLSGDSSKLVTGIAHFPDDFYESDETEGINNIIYSRMEGNYTVFVQDRDTKNILKSSYFQVFQPSTDTTFVNTILIPGIILPGAGAGITYLYSLMAKRRDEKKAKLQKEMDNALAMSKYRMDRVTTKFTDYIDLTNYAAQIAEYTKRFKISEEINNVKLFLSLLRFSDLHDKFVAKGDMLLTDQDAEDVIAQLSHSVIRKIFGIFRIESDYWKFRELNSSRSVASMLRAIRNTNNEYSSYYCTIVTWFAKLDESEKKDFSLLAKSIDELLLYEMNLVYDKWYHNEFFSKKFISLEVLDYLTTKHKFSEGKLTEGKLPIAFPNYYQRILYF